MTFEEDVEATERDERRVRPIKASWSLHIATHIDDHAPGFLSALVRSRGIRRHAMLAVLAATLGDEDGLPCGRIGCPERAAALAALGAVLPMTKPRDAIKTAFGVRELHNLGAFDRLVEPLEPRDYVRLVEALSDPAQRHRHQVLQHTPLIDQDRLGAILALDSALCTVRFARLVRNEAKAKLANDVLAAVRLHRPDLTSDEVREFMSQAHEGMTYTAQLERLLGLVKELPPLGSEVPHGFRHLRAFTDFEECGRRFRNCISTKFVAEALPGRIIYLEYIPRPAIAALMPTSAGLMLSRVHAPANAPAKPDLVEEVRAALAMSGVPYITPGDVTGPLASVRYLLMPHDPFGFGPDEFEDCAPDLD